MLARRAAPTLGSSSVVVVASRSHFLYLTSNVAALLLCATHIGLSGCAARRHADAAGRSNSITIIIITHVFAYNASTH